MAWQTLVSAEHVAEHLADPRLLVFDCRYELTRPEAGREAWSRAHLPGAVHADLHHDLAGPTTPRSGRHPLPDPRRLRRPLATLGRQRRLAAGRLRRRDRHVGGALLVDDGKVAGAPARCRHGWRTAPLAAAGPASDDRSGGPPPGRRVSSANHVPTPGSMRTRHRPLRSIRSAACWTPARRSAIAARWSRSIRWQATCPARSTTRWRASTARTVACVRQANSLSRSGRRSVRWRRPPRSRCAARASRRATCCWRWSTQDCRARACTRAAGASGRGIRRAPWREGKG